MTVSQRGVSYSAGVKGARITKRADGRVTRTLSVPGTGMSYTGTVGGRTGVRPSTGRGVPPPVTAKPGLLAPRWQKALHSAVSRQDVPAIVAVGQQYTEATPHAALLEAVLDAVPRGELGHARELLERLVHDGFDPSVDPFMVKYFPRMGVTIGIADGVSATLTLDRQTIGLVLAEVLQGTGDLTGAVAVVEGLDPTTTAAVSLAELYGEQQRWADVIALTDGLTNEDEPSTYLLVQRGVAFRETGMFAASREALKEALRKKDRGAELRHRALLERANTYLAEGKKSMARRDLERVLAENSQFPGLQDALSNLPSA